MDNKTCGKLHDFALVKEDASRVVVSYGLTDTGKDELYTWYEIYFYKKQGRPTFAMAKDAILNDVNKRTDQKILSGFVWEEQPVWLSSENQFNFKAAYDLAVQSKGKTLPVTFKIGEDENENPIYHTFETMNEFTNFYTSAIGYVNACLTDGWNEKDSIDFEEYKQFFPEENRANDK